MIRQVLMVVGLAGALNSLAPVAASAQAAAPASPPPSPSQSSGTEARTSNLWLTAGTAFATVRGDCQTCEEDTPYRHAGSFVANIGRRINERMDVGAEVFWMPVDTDQGELRTTHLDAVAQFRPWAQRGFFVKGGAGMAFVRNWVDAIGSGAINSKALSVVIGAGWAFRPSERVGLQMLASQHVAALGDLQTAGDAVPDVVGNFWSVGVAIVIR